MKNVATLVTVLSLAVSVFCGSARAETLPTFAAAVAEPIKIGVYLPLSGSNEEGGKSELNGILLGHQQQPKVLGRDVQLVILDNASNQVEAAKAVSRLVGENVIAIIGSYGSSEAVAGGEVAERARIPMLGTSCSNPLVTQGRHYAFRLSFSDGAQAEALARHAVQVLGCKQVMVLSCPTSDYSVGLAAYFKRAFSEAGGKVLGDLPFSEGEKDFSSHVTELMDKRPDLVFFSGYFPEGAHLLKQLGTFPPFRIMGGDSMDSLGLSHMPDGTAEQIVHAAFPYDPTQATAFTGQWKAAYPTMPPTPTGALGYTAYAMLVDAIRRAGQTDTDAVTRALGATTNFTSPVGRLSMDSFHNASTRVGVVEYRGGQRKLKIY